MMCLPIRNLGCGNLSTFLIIIATMHYSLAVGPELCVTACNPLHRPYDTSPVITHQAQGLGERENSRSESRAQDT